MPKAAKRVRLKPADSFDLIRLLARSQNDPRKAVAELVQNSLDAQARRVDVSWFNEHGTRVLRVLDDGEGVFPDLPREEALQTIAQTIGHSHKKHLSPVERQRLMAVGKYGIGLLGFWAVGKFMEIRSRVKGGETWCLKLEEDSPNADLGKARRRRLDEPETFTEVTVLAVHEGVDRQIRPVKLHAYLASELRGQLLRRKVDLEIHDRVARGRSQKLYVVRAQRFHGRPLKQFTELSVPGHEAARVDLYLVDDDERQGRVALACAGSTVLDDVRDIDGTGEPRAPWATGRLEGVIDFPEIEVAPGTRRGFRTNDAANALLESLKPLEAELARVLEEETHREAEARDKDLAKEIRKVFRPLARQLPEYDLFEVKSHAQAGGGAGEGAGVAETSPSESPSPPSPPDTLYPPGPLASVRIDPARSRLLAGATRLLKARALDADARPCAGEVEFEWSLAGAGALAADGARATYAAPEHPAAAQVRVVARQGEVVAEGAAEAEVVDELPEGGGSGVPEPVPVHASAEGWRSRVLDGKWEYNTGHKDYAAAALDERRRLRYLVHLFAKEVVLRNFGQPGDAATLERMVEVLTYLGEARRPAGKREGAPGEGGAAGP